jgi:signal peptidase I
VKSGILSAAVAIFALAAGVSLRATERGPGRIDPGTALADARSLAARHDGAEIVRVEGASMLPFFGSGALLVTKPVTAAALRAGMVVVYRNRFGETVAHRVEDAVDGGWRVRGYNNAREDSTTVNDENLRGVVYAIFHPRTGHGATVDAALTEQLRGTTVALAAPAR